jgi:hypothetical protein
MDIKKIIKEEVGDFDWTNKVEPAVEENYKPCSHFIRPNAKQLCKKINGLKAWLHKDLGLMNVVNETLKDLKVVQDMTDKYQEPLKILHDTGKYPQIKLVNGTYTHDRLLNAGLVLDGDGEYHYVNKLNTNYSDLAEMLTELLVKGGKVDDLANKSQLGIKKYLEGIKPVLFRLIKKYFKPTDLKEFVRNTVGLTRIGDEAEDYASEILQKSGMRELYQGGNGDFIDMLFGIDLIMTHNGRTITCQVKSREGLLVGARKNGYYASIDYFISPIGEIGNGITIFNKKGDNFKINHEGTVQQ